MELVKRYQRAVNRFAASLFGTLIASGDVTDNLVFSPYSVLSLLFMAADATAGSTRGEILYAVDRDLDIEEMRRLQGALTVWLSRKSELLCSNAVCVNENIRDRIVLSYPEELRKLFAGRLFCFGDMVGEVNAWVRKSTRGMIDGILDRSAAGLLLCMVNALAFQAKWKEPYEAADIRDGMFRNADGSETELPVLRSFEDYYVEDDLVTGFIKPYKGGAFSFMALLPKDDSYEGLLRAAAETDWTALYRSRRYGDVHVRMPEFSCDTAADISGFCQSLGIRRMFGSAADFSPLADEWLRAEAILHKAHIEVDRCGTKAAAASAMVAVAACAMSEDYRAVFLDRPFLYAVMCNDPLIPVFTGAVKKL